MQKLLITLVTVSALLGAGYIFLHESQSNNVVFINDLEMQAQWNAFKTTHGKTY
jgi:hypothetical protein